MLIAVPGIARTRDSPGRISEGFAAGCAAKATKQQPGALSTGVAAGGLQPIVRLKSEKRV
jgi:hypothetical protein